MSICQCMRGVGVISKGWSRSGCRRGERKEGGRECTRLTTAARVKDYLCETSSQRGTDSHACIYTRAEADHGHARFGTRACSLGARSLANRIAVDLMSWPAPSLKRVECMTLSSSGGVCVAAVRGTYHWRHHPISNINSNYIWTIIVHQSFSATDSRPRQPHALQHPLHAFMHNSIIAPIAAALCCSANPLRKPKAQ